MSLVRDHQKTGTACALGRGGLNERLARAVRGLAIGLLRPWPLAGHHRADALRDHDRQAENLELEGGPLSVHVEAEHLVDALDPLLRVHVGRPPVDHGHGVAPEGSDDPLVCFRAAEEQSQILPQRTNPLRVVVDCSERLRDGPIRPFAKHLEPACLAQAVVDRRGVPEQLLAKLVEMYRSGSGIVLGECRYRKIGGVAV